MTEYASRCTVHTFALSTPPGVSGLAMDSWILVSRFVVELSSLAILASAFLCSKPLELKMLEYPKSIHPHSITDPLALANVKYLFVLSVV